MTEPAFWDTSATVPLCVQEKGTKEARQLLAKYGMVVWWATAVEIHSALARIGRMGLLSTGEYLQARERMEDLRRSWREIQPSEPLRNIAEMLLERFALHVADSLHLAAALTWCRQRPHEHFFLAGDKQLLDAARALGFNALEV